MFQVCTFELNLKFLLLEILQSLLILIIPSGAVEIFGVVIYIYIYHIYISYIIYIYICIRTNLSTILEIKWH